MPFGKTEETVEQKKVGRHVRRESCPVYSKATIDDVINVLHDLYRTD